MIINMKYVDKCVTVESVTQKVLRHFYFRMWYN